MPSFFNLKEESGYSSARESSRFGSERSNVQLIVSGPDIRQFLGIRELQEDLTWLQ